MRKPEKEYLGDAVYVDFDGFYIVLMTEDGVRATNQIYLEPQVLEGFERYVKKVRATIKEAQEESRGS